MSTRLFILGEGYAKETGADAPREIRGLEADRLCVARGAAWGVVFLCLRFSSSLAMRCSISACSFLAAVLPVIFPATVSKTPGE